jgi:hypothetical protein
LDVGPPADLPDLKGCPARQCIDPATACSFHRWWRLGRARVLALMGAGAKKLGAMAVVLSVLAAVVGGCHSAPPGQAPPAAQSPLSDVPPPLVPAMDLPANAVDSAVSKLDDMADELMKKSGIPGMAVAVVHGGKTVYAKGFGVKDVRSGDKVDPDTVLEDLGYERQYVLERLRQLVYA